MNRFIHLAGTGFSPQNSASQLISIGAPTRIAHIVCQAYARYRMHSLNCPTCFSVVSLLNGSGVRWTFHILRCFVRRTEIVHNFSNQRHQDQLPRWIVLIVRSRRHILQVPSWFPGFVFKTLISRPQTSTLIEPHISRLSSRMAFLHSLVEDT
jgi:hypothetical protein